ncbi:hypothetical protein GGI12_002890 [Dipsacomyces acuminosporus]|nr:hypothetical protein GGI12_002890 [Dipsacomyces acuminosporus]
MATLESLIEEYGKFVDKELIASIWTEQSSDQAKCRDIIHMLSGLGGGAASKYSPIPSDSASTPCSDTSSCISEPIGISSITNANSGPAVASAPSSSTAAAEAAAEATAAKTPEAITSPAVLVEFLAACFPECGADYLQTKVSETFGTRDTPSFKVDPIEAIDIISNALYNDMESVEHQQYQQQNRSISPQSTTINSKQSSDLTSTSLADIQSKYTVSGSKSRSKGSKKRSKERSGGADGFTGSAYRNAEYQAPSNVWNTIDAELESICSIFPMLSVGTVRSTYHACGANIDQTVERLSAAVEKISQTKPRTGADVLRGARSQSSAQPPAKRSAKQVSETLGALRMLFPDHGDDVLQAAARDANDTDSAVDKVLRLSSSNSSNSSNDTKPKMDARWRRADDLSSLRVSPSSSGMLVGNGTKVHDLFERVPLADLCGDARAWAADHNIDPQQCRAKAEAFIEKRNELYRKAAEAYSRRKSSNNHGATALYYSTEGHKYDAKARVWRMRAAQATVAAMKRNSQNIIDLHGVPRAEAVAIALEEANAWYTRLKGTDDRLQQHTDTLHIITGLGKHSADGKAHVHPSVVRALREDGWWFEEGHGFIDVLGVRQGGMRM